MYSEWFFKQLDYMFFWCCLPCILGAIVCPRVTGEEKSRAVWIPGAIQDLKKRFDTPVLTLPDPHAACESGLGIGRRYERVLQHTGREQKS